ncbi:hypothetical protein GUJ93_ZPchr0006g42311 [Zizania palustris]|uniref:Uncharacterized protein n=1 Tax=Zizania palustris TaxID=103762 RepID=A0A8J5VH43_ZIZPA|nr:hypothetical protein GUJ93_ZPchr0006g42311 [Zizania palustris]
MPLCQSVLGPQAWPRPTWEILRAARSRRWTAQIGPSHAERILAVHVLDRTPRRSPFPIYFYLAASFSPSSSSAGRRRIVRLLVLLPFLLTPIRPQRYGIRGRPDSCLPPRLPGFESPGSGASEGKGRQRRRAARIGIFLVSTVLVQPNSSQGSCENGSDLHGRSTMGIPWSGSSEHELQAEETAA